ncbi:tetratricopeptide repeat protein [candidate division WOR-3 bacterium]|nr:tetratricopeptide repeat protein [candidate division WOR-3 bacterium]
MGKKYIVLFILIMLNVSIAQQVSEDSLDLMLVRAKTFYNSGEYEHAISELEKALQYLKQLEKGDQVEAYKYLGFSYVAFGDKAKAKEQFKKALVLKPNLTLDPAIVSPKIIKIFEEAKAELPTVPFITPVVEPTKPSVAKQEVSTSGAMMRSCCIPGWGQMYKGQDSKGKRMMIAAGVTFGVSIISWVLQEAAHTKYLDVGPGNIHEMDDAYKRYKFWYSTAVFTSLTFIGVYFYNIYDVIFTKPATGSSMINLDKGIYCTVDKNRFQIGYNISF